MFIETLTRPRVCEPVAAAFSIVGSALIALNLGNLFNFNGFVAFFVANILLIILFAKKKMYWLVAQQGAFMATTLLGLYNYSQLI